MKTENEKSVGKLDEVLEGEKKEEILINESEETMNKIEMSKSGK